MKITSAIFLLSGCFCLLMLLSLHSLSRLRVPGVREWSAANAIALVSFLLYAFDGILPPLLTYEGANFSYALASITILVGLRRFFMLPVHAGKLAVAFLAQCAAVTYFHYGYYSFAWRTLSVSLFECAVLLATAATILGARKSWRSHYPYLLTAGAAIAIAVGHLLRAGLHMAQADQISSLMEPAPWNIFFISAGALILPALTYGAMMMVHDRVLAHAEDASSRDFLTGALSRRSFYDILERELSRTRRAASRLSILLLDVDRLGAINDAFGDKVGDEVLADLALRANAAIRSDDCFARLGGARFAALLSDTDHDTALSLAERLRTTLEAASDIPLCTVSVGVATLRGEDSMAALLARAQRALDAAKTRKGNRVHGDALV